MSPLSTPGRHCSSDRPVLSCEAAREEDLASSSPFLALCPGRSDPEAGRTRSAPGTGVQPRPRRLVPFAGARSRPLPRSSSFPLPSAPFSFPPHPTPPHPTPSLRELAGQPLAVHLVPLCAFPLSLLRGGSGGGGGGGGGAELGRRFLLRANPQPEGHPGRRWRVVCAGVGVGGAWTSHILWARSETVCFAFHLSFLKRVALWRGIGWRGEEEGKQCISVLRTEVGSEGCSYVPLPAAPAPEGPGSQSDAPSGSVTRTGEGALRFPGAALPPSCVRGRGPKGGQTECALFPFRAS